MAIQDLILGSLVSRGADRLLNPEDKNLKTIDNLISGGGYTGKGTSGKSKGKSTLGGIAKQGIMGLIAQSILGPIFGPLALTLGSKFFGKNPNITKGLGLGLNEDQTQPGPRGGVTATGMQFENIQDSLGSIDPGTDIDYNTGDITDAATGITTGNVYDEVALTGGDSSSDDGSNGGGGGQSDSQAGADAAQQDDSAGAGGYAYGGRASYSGGGLASLL